MDLTIPLSGCGKGRPEGGDFGDRLAPLEPIGGDVHGGRRPAFEEFAANVPHETRLEGPAFDS